VARGLRFVGGGAAFWPSGEWSISYGVRVLAVDTTTPRGSLAVVTEEGVSAEVRVTTTEGHSRWLLPAVDAALKGLAVAPEELDAFAVTVGPGSFTGLRVGISTVQGLALAAAKPCLGSSSLDVLARAGRGRAPTVVALVDAFRDEVFGAVYDEEGRARGDPWVGPPESFVAGLEGAVALVGDGARRHRGRLERGGHEPRFPEVDLFLAGELGRWAIGQLAEGRGRRPGDLRPLYLRPPDIRKPRP
jgi:tRNA threonylcarbamoyladenosine biosynthesis protein TsaB